ncbi:tetratricopeptide repeat protein [Streptomyces anthocyanicus]|uniref:phosphorylase family protein n=1 Tax=Streptomyces anthocyanicus TaxID=68174 RepID=UPI002F911258|nr:tetratricopeptide repeat protein [Streptomyces anthocyanicus]
MSSNIVLGTVVICTALDIEYIAVREHLEGPFDEREERGTIYQIGTFSTDRGRWTVALTQTGAGNTQAGVQLERAIAVFHPTLVLFVGVAGGRKDVALGDVVIADAIYDYESGKDTAEDYLPRIKTTAPSHRLLRRAGQLARDGAWQHRILPTEPEKSPNAVVKPIAAGGKVVADENSATARFLNRHCGDAAAVEMEGHGFLHGAYVNDTVQALVVRGISDLLSGKTEAADARWQPAASRHAAAFAAELLARYTAPSAMTAGAVPRQLLAAPAGFVGRIDQFAALDRLLPATDGAVDLHGGHEAGATAVISAIGGTGGIGKTWLALTWANRNVHHFSDGQLSVDLRGFSPGEPRHPVDVLADFLAALGVDRDQQPADLDARVALYRTHTTGKRMLILLDNAATPDQVVPLLPGGTTCTVLITSRDRLRGLIARHGARPVHVDVLTDTEARTLLNRALGDTRPGNDTIGPITELIGLCGGFPLALGLITARARTHPELLEDLVAELRDLGLDALDSDDPESSLPTVLSWSLRHLTDEQRTLFGLLGIAPGPDAILPAVVSLAALAPARARRALSALEEASLVERRPGDRYFMHDLVRDYAATAARDLPDDVRQSALVRVTDFHLHTAHAADRLLNPHRQPARPEPPAPGVHPQPLPDAAAAIAWLEAEHATLLATQRTAAALSRYPVVWHLAWALETFHYRRGHRHDALSSWQAALDAAAYLPDPTIGSRTYRFLGRAYSRLGLHEEATGHLDRALELAVCHHDLTEQAHTHRVLAAAWELRGEDQQALDHARHALALYRTLGQSTGEAETLNQVGWYSARLGDYDTARDYCSAALTLHRDSHNYTGEAATLDSLGFIAHCTGEHRQALDHYRQALTLRRTLSHAYQVADTLEGIGHPYITLGQRDQARAVWQEALDLYQEQGRDTDAQRVQQQLDKLDNPNGVIDSHK